METTLELSKSGYLILRSLSRGERSYWELILEQETSGKYFIPELKRLMELGYVQQDPDTKKFRMTEKGKQFYLSRFREYIPVICEHCRGKGMLITGQFKDVLDKFKEIAVDRPKAIPEYDQGYVEEEVTVMRTVYLYQRGDLEGKRIVLIGDDDLTGIALSLTGMPESVTVLEADERIVDYTNKIARKLNLNNLKAYIYDVRKPLPKEMQRSFDVFITDPVETLEGFTLFISRGVGALRGEGGSGYFGISYVEASFKKWYRLHTRLYQMNLVITDIIPHFQRYMLDVHDILNKGYRIVKETGLELREPDVNWYNSAFYRVELVDEPKPYYSPNTELNLGRELYFDDEAFVTLY